MPRVISVFLPTLSTDRVRRKTGDAAPPPEAPLILVGRTLVRDAERLGYEEIDGTNAWEDDGGHAEYVLRCELLPVPAKITSVTALP